METTEYKKKYPGLASTIIAGILITFFLMFVIVIFTTNLKETLEAHKASAPESGENGNDGEMSMVFNIFYAFGALAIIVFYYFAVLAPLIASPFLLMSSISNIKKGNKTIRVFNIVFIPLLALVVVACVLKIVLLIVHIG